MRSRYSWYLLPTLVILGVIGWAISSVRGSTILNPLGEVVEKKVLPYEKYSFDNLAKRGGVASKIEVEGDKFYYYSEGRRISGEINLPDLSGVARKAPVVVMARGYVDKEIYKTGIGTHNAAVAYAKEGYITLAPDFSGYGESDEEDESALGARLVKPVEVLDLLAGLQTLPHADLSRVYLWGHSNGGQIMLSVAEILGKREELGIKIKDSRIVGVTLWAPVSKPFPYNILYYTDEADDQGKWLRGEIAKFETEYDVFEYSIDRYLDQISIPIQIHQGSLDDAVPKIWSDKLVKTLEEGGKEVNYYVYPGADHNMRPGWDSVVARDLDFFESL